MALFRVAALLSIVALASGESSVEFQRKFTALQKAQEWLSTHQDPVAAGDQAGMAELKTANPDAYAIVNALLTKKSLGLLNSRHPTAAMSPSDAADAPLDTPQPGLEPKPAFTAPVVEVATPDAVDVELPSEPQHHDFLHWKPPNDETMVSNVLGMVAGLTGGHAPQVASAVQAVEPPHVQPQVRPEAQQPMALPEAQPQPQPQPQHHASVLSFDWGNTYAGQGQAVQSKRNYAQPISASPAMKVPAQQVPAQQDQSNNPYLKGIDFSSELTPATTSQIAVNSYLKGFNSGDAPQPKANAINAKDIGAPNKLTNFNWYNN
jgi:hypothetical protein